MKNFESSTFHCVFLSTFLCLSKEKLQKKGHLAGALLLIALTLRLPEGVSCPRTSHHAQCAGGAVIHDGFKSRNFTTGLREALQ